MQYLQVPIMTVKTLDYHGIHVEAGSDVTVIMEPVHQMLNSPKRTSKVTSIMRQYGVLLVWTKFRQHSGTGKMFVQSITILLCGFWKRTWGVYFYGGHHCT
jgi:hypothetical protein